MSTFLKCNTYESQNFLWRGNQGVIKVNLQTRYFCRLELKVIINLCQTLSLFAPHLSLIFASRSRKSPDKKPGEENLTRNLGNDKSGSPIHLVPSCPPFKRGRARNLGNDRRLQRLTWLAPFSKGIPWRRPEAQEQGSIGRKVQKVNNYKRDIS